MRASALLFLVALLTPESTPCSDSAMVVDVDKVIRVAEFQASKALDTGRCKAAFKTLMPGYDDEWELRATFDNQVKYHRTPGFIVNNPFAWAVVDCDKSQKTFLISDAWAGWIGISSMKEAMIHEYVHLLRCEAILHDCGTQANCQPSRHVAEEVLAYKIAAICVGR